MEDCSALTLLKARLACENLPEGLLCGDAAQCLVTPEMKVGERQTECTRVSVCV